MQMFQFVKGNEVATSSHRQMFQFVKGNEVATSSHRQDYKPYGTDVQPDTAVRRNALSKSEVSESESF